MDKLMVAQRLLNKVFKEKVMENPFLKALAEAIPPHPNKDTSHE